jgi:hypothetical protein
MEVVEQMVWQIYHHQPKIIDRHQKSPALEGEEQHTFLLTQRFRSLS